MKPSQIFLTVSAIGCGALAMLCALGLVASFEPGISVNWKIGYGLAILVLTSLAIWCLSRI